MQTHGNIYDMHTAVQKERSCLSKSPLPDILVNRKTSLFFKDPVEMILRKTGSCGRIFCPYLLIQMFFDFPTNVAMLFGGTSLIILVGVDLETMRQLDGMMKMHHHDGFIDAKKHRLKKF